MGGTSISIETNRIYSVIPRALLHLRNLKVSIHQLQCLLIVARSLYLIHFFKLLLRGAQGSDLVRR
jgi:hypothetical protein